MSSVRGNLARKGEIPFAEIAGPTKAPRSQLTRMEEACLRLVAKHLSSKEIAVELGIAKTSVDTYCNRARAKLGVSDRYEAARRLISDQKLADHRPRPNLLTIEADPSPARQKQSIEQSAQVKHRRRPWLLGAILTVLAIALGLATLLSGLRALEAMKPY